MATVSTSTGLDRIKSGYQSLFEALKNNTQISVFNNVFNTTQSIFISLKVVVQTISFDGEITYGNEADFSVTEKIHSAVETFHEKIKNYNFPNTTIENTKVISTASTFQFKTATETYTLLVLLKSQCVMPTDEWQIHSNFEFILTP